MTDESSAIDLNALFAQAQEVQQQLAEAHAAAAAEEIEGHAGGGLVRISGTAGLDVQHVTIAADVVDPTDIPMLEDLVVAAMRDFVAKAQARQAEALGGFGDLGSLLGPTGP